MVNLGSKLFEVVPVKALRESRDYFTAKVNSLRSSKDNHQHNKN